MYQSEYGKAKKVEKVFEKLAYFSIFLDVMVAAATYLTIQNGSITFFLEASDYLILLEVILAGVLLALIGALRYYRRLLRPFNKMFFKSRYRKYLGK